MKAGADAELALSASGEHGRFSYLMIDGKLIDASDYTITGSRTDAILSEELLRRLEDGDHTIMFVYEDGWATASFSVAGNHGPESECGVDRCEPETEASAPPKNDIPHTT